eukprot:TRINITY_DN3421_c3_g2_i2.p1 TRINITY_DN3421_c3_g2~~TRINITY_DN3421_c3_g2_i2.p1  ORF type:complete len:619 (-),score=111.20 TRINITY_DN3421_c3_g2_i2:244-2100(-)
MMIVRLVLLLLFINISFQVYVSVDDGVDSENCGSEEIKCKTLLYAVNKNKEENVEYILSPGIYNEIGEIKIEYKSEIKKNENEEGIVKFINDFSIEINKDIKIENMEFIDSPLFVLQEASSSETNEIEIEINDCNFTDIITNFDSDYNSLFNINTKGIALYINDCNFNDINNAVISATPINKIEINNSVFSQITTNDSLFFIFSSVDSKEMRIIDSHFTDINVDSVLLLSNDETGYNNIFSVDIKSTEFDRNDVENIIQNIGYFKPTTFTILETNITNNVFDSIMLLTYAEDVPSLTSMTTISFHLGIIKNNMFKTSGNYMFSISGRSSYSFLFSQTDIINNIDGGLINLKDYIQCSLLRLNVDSNYNNKDTVDSFISLVQTSSESSSNLYLEKNQFLSNHVFNLFSFQELNDSYDYVYEKVEEPTPDTIHNIQQVYSNYNVLYTANNEFNNNELTESIYEFDTYSAQIDIVTSNFTNNLSKYLIDCTNKNDDGNSNEDPINSPRLFFLGEDPSVSLDNEIIDYSNDNTCVLRCTIENSEFCNENMEDYYHQSNNNLTNFWIFFILLLGFVLIVSVITICVLVYSYYKKFLKFASKFRKNKYGFKTSIEPEIVDLALN